MADGGMDSALPSAEFSENPVKFPSSSSAWVGPDIGPEVGMPRSAAYRDGHFHFPQTPRKKGCRERSVGDGAGSAPAHWRIGLTLRWPVRRYSLTLSLRALYQCSPCQACLDCLTSL